MSVWKAFFFLSPTALPTGHVWHSILEKKNKKSLSYNYIILAINQFRLWRTLYIHNVLSTNAHLHTHTYSCINTHTHTHSTYIIRGKGILPNRHSMKRISESDSKNAVVSCLIQNYHNITLYSTKNRIERSFSVDEFWTFKKPEESLKRVFWPVRELTIWKQ